MIVTGWWWKSFKSRRRYTYSTLEETVIRAGIQEAANVDVVFGFVDEHDEIYQVYRTERYRTRPTSFFTFDVIVNENQLNRLANIQDLSYKIFDLIEGKRNVFVRTEWMAGTVLRIFYKNDFCNDLNWEQEGF